MNQYQIRRLTRDDIGDLRDLIKICFKANLGLEELEAKYGTSKFFSKDPIGYFAINEHGSPVAYYGVFPIYMQIGNGKVLCAQSGDTMTHPQHTGKGLFTLLAKQTYETALAEGIECIFGFPNKNSFPGFIKKLNWVQTGTMTNFTLPVKTIPLQKVPKVFKPAYFVTRPWTKVILQQKVQENFEFEDQNNYPRILHDKNFFGYKTGNDSVWLKCGKIKIFVKLNLWFIIGFIDKPELLGINETNAIKKLAALLGFDKIFYSCSDNHPSLPFVSKFFNQEEGLPVCWLNNSRLEELKKMVFTSADFDTF